ncbi:MAG: NAD(P)H-hydrate dehydratase [Phycisphaerales bacterium]|nr:NAD(P)H-hydrate dehydratase [Planctomycetota bacterium]MCH8509144.1 NAD(P)H-hydrate dehydratase [Phycisphaerales bacterium]
MHETIETIPPLPVRPRDGHKGTFGRVGVVGGCASDDPRMVGAPALAALGAARSGCGLVKIGAPGSILDAALTLAPFATGLALPMGLDGLDPAGAAERFDELAAGVDALCVGVGLGQSRGARAVVLRSVLQEDAPVVLDADGLNLLASEPEFWRELRASLVLTPHPGEARRLMEALSLRGDPAGDEAGRVGVCVALARRLGCLVVLKGSGTAVSDGLRAWVCRAGHPCLGTGGTGDVLAGVLAGLIAQSHADPARDLFSIVQAGVQAHAEAGEAWAAASGATGGMTPTDLAGLIPARVEALRAKN